MADEKIISLRIQAQNATKAAFDEVKADTAKLGTDVEGGLGAKFEHFGELAKKAFENPTAALGDLAGGLKGNLTEALGGTATAAVGVVGAIAAVAVGMYELAEKAAAVGGEINDMSEKTGISVPALSALKGAAEIAGSSLEQVSNAVFKLQQNIGEDSEKVATGFSRIGLSLDEIKKLQPDQQFIAIAHAIKATEDPATRAAAAVEIFGKQGRDLLPLMMKPLDELVNKSKELGLVWSEEDAAAAEEFEMEVRTLKMGFEGIFISIGRDLMPVVSALGHGFMQVGTAMGWITGVIPIYGLFKDVVTSAYRSIADLLTRVFETTAEAKERTEKLAAASKIAGHEVTDYKEAVRILNEHLKQTPGASNVAATAAEEYKKALANGKGDLYAFGQLLTLVQGHQTKLAEEMSRFGPDTLAQAMEALKNNSAAFDEWAKYVGLSKEAIAFLKEQVQQQTEAQRKHTEEVKKADEAHRKFLEVVHEVTSANGSLADRIAQLDGNVVEGIKYYLERGVALEKLATMYGLTKEQADAVGLQMKFTASVSDATTKAFKDQGIGIGLLNARYGDTHAALTGLENDGETLAATVIGMDENVFAFANQEAYAAQQSAGLRDKLRELRSEGGSLGSVLKGSLGGLNGIFQSAFEGGGGVTGAVKSLATNVGAGLLNMIPVVGPFVSQFAGSIVAGISKIFGGGPSQQELDGRKIEKAFEDSFGGFEPMMAKIGAVYEATGRSAAQAQADVKRLLDAEKQGGPAVQSVIDTINAAFTDQKLHADAVASGVDGIVAAAKAAGGSIPASLRAVITTLQASKDLTDAEKKSLGELVTAAVPNFAALEQTASKYGITLAGLGGKFQQAHLDDTAQQIFKDFQDITDAGGDVGGVLSGMSDEFSSLVGDAKKFGASIPLAMKPMIEELSRSGQLLDENGDKITDLTGIKWADTPLDKGTNAIVDAIHELRDTLANLPGVAKTAADGIGSALQDAAKNVPTINVPYRFEQQGDVPAFADEAYVRRPTLAIVGDTPGGEFVLKPSTVQRLIDRAAELGASSAPSVDFSRLEAKFDQLLAAGQRQFAALQSAIAVQPYAARDAVLVRGSR